MARGSIELLCDARSAQRARHAWSALSQAGLPSQAHRRSSSNAPHVTVVSADGGLDRAEATTAEALAPLLPAEVPVAGTVVLGGRTCAIAWLLTLSPALVDAVEQVRAQVEEPNPARFVAHLTLASQVPREEAGRVLEAVLALGRQAPLVLGGVRRWDPATQRNWTVGPDHSRG